MDISFSGNYNDSTSDNLSHKELFLVRQQFNWKVFYCCYFGSYGGCYGFCYRWPPISTGYVSAALCLRHASGADMFHFSLCVNPHQVCCAAYLLRPSSGSPEPSRTDTQDFYIWYDAAIQLNLAPSRQEVKRENESTWITRLNIYLCVNWS